MHIAGVHMAGEHIAEEEHIRSFEGELIECMG